jgi:hypothetical protein
MLFHLAHPFLAGQKRIQVETALERLIDRHGRGNWGDFSLKLTFPRNPNGLYLLKGGGRDVWNAFGVRKKWRRGQGSLPANAAAPQRTSALLPASDGATGWTRSRRLWGEMRRARPGSGAISVGRSPLSCCTQDGDDEGIIRIDQLPNAEQAAAIRKAIGLTKRPAVDIDVITRNLSEARRLATSRPPAHMGDGAGRELAADTIARSRADGRQLSEVTE